VSNVLKKLETPYVPGVLPDYGPVFRRDGWREDFLKKVNSKDYVCYYGASSLGKSVAITNALKDRRGVMYIPLRQSDKIAHHFGYYGTEKGESSPNDFTEYLDTFKVAVQQFNKKYKQKVVVVIDDIHDDKTSESSKISLAHYLIELHNAGYINCVYSVSDYQAVSFLRQLSGHSTRFRSELFPSIPDEDLEKQLKDLIWKKKLVEHELEQSVFSFINSASEEHNCTLPKVNFVFQNPDDVKLVVKYLDSHMGAVTSVLRSIIEEKKNQQRMLLTKLSMKMFQ